MSTHPVPAVTAVFSLFLITAALPAQTADTAAPPAGVTKVRIVRLSEVKGNVQVDRNTGSGFEAAMPNLPIVEQNRLETGTGVAEVEFEDNSTVRLAPDSEVIFPQLERLADGTTVSSVQLLKGTAYVSLVKKAHGDDFSLLFGQQKLELAPASHVRLQMEGGNAKLAVLDGSVPIQEASGPAEVSKKKTVTFDLQGQQSPIVAKNITAEAFDSWDQNAAAYHARSANASALNGTPYAYGLTDMTYYGSFVNAGGCGSMWRPYFASAAWDPYSNGAWAWYPGSGYGWVSPYPWGWTPYHYGSWGFCPGMGWGWQPGGIWNGLNNAPAVAPGSGPRHVPVAPIRPPRRGTPTLTAVNSKPLVMSQLASMKSFMFRRDSAGMGIPRNGLGRLDKLSRSAVEHGSASTAVYLNVPRSGVNGGRSTNGAPGPVSVHRGYAMAPSAGMAPRPGMQSRSGMSPGMSSRSTMSVGPASSGAHMGAAPSGGGGHAH